MQFTAVNQDGDPVEDAVFYSTGGGFVSSEQELLHPEERDRETFPFPYESAEELLHMADERGCPLSSIVMANECAMLPEREVREKLDLIWTTMKQSISNGMSARGNLPGVLQVPRPGQNFAQESSGARRIGLERPSLHYGLDQSVRHCRK